MNIFIAGDRGMLAHDLRISLLRDGRTVTGADLPELDITDSSSVRRMFDRDHPNMVINCAAYTAVDSAETDRECAMEVNGRGPGVLGHLCTQYGMPLIHISTDFVFNGALRRPYREDDTTDPLNVYGATKLAGEESVRKECPQHLIIRTAWLYGVRGGNFVKTMLRLARERDEIRVVHDQTGCPTWSSDFADALSRISGIIEENSGIEQWGTYHFTGAGMTTWHGFAKAAIDEARRYEILRVEHIKPITAAEYPTPARRPSWSVLDTGKIAAVFGITPSPWEQSLRKMIHEFYESENRKSDSSG